MCSVTRLNLLMLLTIQCFCIDLPPDFPVCYIDGPDINGCLLNAAKQLKPKVLKGIEELGLPYLDPLVIPTYNLQVDKSVIQLNSSLSNMTVNGFQNYDFKQIGYDPETKSFYGSLGMPLLEIDTDITSMHARLIFITLEGAGHGYTAYGPLEASFKVDGEIVMKNEVEYYNPIRAQVNLKVQDGYYHFTGIFDNDTELNYLTNMLLNRNSETIAYAVTPGLTILAERGLLWLMTSLANKVPYQQLFPHSNATLNRL